MGDKEEALIVCSPTEWGALKPKVEGTLESVCAECGQPVMLSPSGLRLMAEQSARTVCSTCATRIAAMGGGVVHALTEEQIEELFDVCEKDPRARLPFTIECAAQRGGETRQFSATTTLSEVLNTVTLVVGVGATNIRVGISPSWRDDVLFDVTSAVMTRLGRKMKENNET